MTQSPLRILVVDDDANLAASVAEVLNDDGRFSVVGHAVDGAAALELVEREAPDVVLMDIALPGADGIDTTRAIHERDADQHVVIYTGSDEYGDVARADEAGAIGFLHKSVLTSPDLPDALAVLHENYVAAFPDVD